MLRIVIFFAEKNRKSELYSFSSMAEKLNSRSSSPGTPKPTQCTRGSTTYLGWPCLDQPLRPPSTRAEEDLRGSGDLEKDKVNANGKTVLSEKKVKRSSLDVRRMSRANMFEV